MGILTALSLIKRVIACITIDCHCSIKTEFFCLLSSPTFVHTPRPQNFPMLSWLNNGFRPQSVSII